MKWRSVRIVLATWRDWRTLGGVVIAIAVAAVTVTRSQANFSSAAVFYVPVLLATTVLGGLVQHVRRAAIWRTLLQRPVSAEGELWRLLGGGWGVYLVLVAVILGAALLGLAENAAVPRVRLLAVAVTGALWAGTSGLVVSVVASFASGSVAALSIGWILSPVLLSLVDSAAQLPDPVHGTLTFLMPSIDAIFGLGSYLAGDVPSLDPWHPAHLIGFPLLCLGILAWRFRVIARSERVGSE